MRTLLFAFLACVAVAGTSCKDKLEKKDKSLEEMQDEDHSEHYKPILDGADARIYKTIDTTKLYVNIYYPPKHSASDRVPAIIYFFAGGFVQGSPEQNEDNCKYYAGLGLVTMAADYRVISRNNTTGLECIYDAKSMVRWAREHADELGIDPGKIIVAGGSAGGCLAIQCALNNHHFEEKTDDTSFSCVPDAMVLVNPVINTQEFPFRERKFKENKDAPDSTSHAEELNPMKHLAPQMPPAILFQGTADRMAKTVFARNFTKKMNAQGDSVELHEYPGQKHGFVQQNVEDGKYYYEARALTDTWLTKLGYLSPANKQQ